MNAIVNGIINMRVCFHILNKQVKMATFTKKKPAPQKKPHLVFFHTTRFYEQNYLSYRYQGVLTPETRVTRTVDPELGMEERLVMALWQFPSWHLARTEARYLLGQITYVVGWEHMYDMLRQLASLESRAFVACTSDHATIHGAPCYLPDRPEHLYKCQPTKPSDDMQLGDRNLHSLLIGS